MRATALTFLSLLGLSACLDLTVDPRPLGLDLSDCPGCAEENDLEGEVLLLVNRKLSDASSLYTSNQQDEDGNYVGSSLFLYDPDRPGHLVKLGNVLFGKDPDNGQGWSTASFRDVAWSKERGLWGLTIDRPNDEWRLTHIEVPDLRGHDQLLPQRSYALRSTDAAYWEEELTGLAIVGGSLILGGRGAPGRDSPGGALYRAGFPEAWGVDPAWPDDTEFYADRNLSTLWGRLPSNLGVAGDLCQGPDGELLVLVRSEHGSAAPLDVNLLFESPPGEVALSRTNVSIPVKRNEDLQGLAWIKGRLLAIDTQGKVYEIDRRSGTARLHDDLLPLFDDPQGVRIHGATTVDLSMESSG